MRKLTEEELGKFRVLSARVHRSLEQMAEEAFLEGPAERVGCHLQNYVETQEEIQHLLREVGAVGGER